MDKYDLLILVLLGTALYFIDIDKNAVKALVTGGVAGIWLSRKL